MFTVWMWTFGGMAFVGVYGGFWLMPEDSLAQRVLVHVGLASMFVFILQIIFWAESLRPFVNYTGVGLVAVAAWAAIRDYLFERKAKAEQLANHHRLDLP